MDVVLRVEWTKCHLFLAQPADDSDESKFEAMEQFIFASLKDGGGNDMPLLKAEMRVSLLTEHCNVTKEYAEATV